MTGPMTASSPWASGGRARAHGADSFSRSMLTPCLKHTRGAPRSSPVGEASDREAAALAERENRSDLIAVSISGSGPEVNEILFDLTRRQTNNSRSAWRKSSSPNSATASGCSPFARSAAFVVLKHRISVGPSRDRVPLERDEERALRETLISAK